MHGTSMNFTARFARRLKARNKAKICKISVLEQNANENSDYIDKIKYLPLQGYSTLLQIQMFWEDMAMKGTFLVNHKVYNLNMQTNV